MEIKTRTSILVTAGPSLSNPARIREAIERGARVFRLNFSHGTYETHAALIEAIREASRETGVEVAILQDLSGPKIRVGELAGEPFRIKPGYKVELVKGKADRPGVIPVDYPYLVDDLQPEEKVLIEDGKIELEVVEKKRDRLVARVITGGVIRAEKGVNLPDSSLRIPSFTEKDRRDLEFGLEKGVDMVALSFVSSPDDVVPVRKMAGQDLPVIAKIERKEALRRLDEIIDAFDGIMVARGDLGVEVAVEKLPLIQKKLIAEANRKGKVVITATQMLESMVKSPKPTRAEVSDVANAVLDGSDALMLSAETAVGRYPIRAIETMARIVRETEESVFYWNLRKLQDMRASDPTEALAEGAVITAEKIGAAAIAVFTASGRTALCVSKFRPRAKIFALTPELSVQRKLMLCWGVLPLLIEFEENTDRMIERGLNLIIEMKLVKPGSYIVLTAGKTPMRGATDMVKVVRI